MTALLRTILVPQVGRILGQEPCPNLSHTPLGHCNPSQKQPVTILSHMHPLGQPKHPRFSLQSQCPNLSPLRGRCASSPRPPHLPDKGPTTTRRTAMTTDHPTTAHDTNPTGHDTTHARGSSGTDDTTREAHPIDLVQNFDFMEGACAVLRRYDAEAAEALENDDLIFEADYVAMIIELPSLAAHVAAAVAEKETEIERLSTELDELEQAVAALCDDDWLRKRDRCMELNGTHARHSRDAASAWESAASDLRSLLGQDYEDRIDRHDTYLVWMRGDRDRGQAERGEVPVEKRYRGWPAHARTSTEGEG